MGYTPAVIAYVFIILLSMLLGAAGVPLMQRLIPVERRKPHNAAIATLFGALYVLFGVIVGFTSFIVLNKYNSARTTVQNEAADVAQIYMLAQQLPQSKRDQIQKLDESYVRVVVEKEWPLMSQGRTNPHAQALADDLTSAIQEFKPTTSNEQVIYSHELDAVSDLDKDRVTRLLDVGYGLPPLLWIALVLLLMPMLLFACLMGVEDTRLHMLGVSALVGAIAVVLSTIFLLDRPFGTEFRVGPQPFELVLHKIEGTSSVGEGLSHIVLRQRPTSQKAVKRKSNFGEDPF